MRHKAEAMVSVDEVCEGEDTTDSISGHPACVLNKVLAAALALAVGNFFVDGGSRRVFSRSEGSSGQRATSRKQSWSFSTYEVPLIYRQYRCRF